MIESCQRCGGLYATENMEAFAGTPCRCPQPLKWSPTFGDMNTTAVQFLTPPVSVQAERHEFDPDAWRVCKVCGAQGDVLCKQGQQPRSVHTEAPERKGPLGNIRLLHQAVEGENVCTYCKLPMDQWLPGTSCHAREIREGVRPPNASYAFTPEGASDPPEHVYIKPLKGKMADSYTWRSERCDDNEIEYARVRPAAQPHFDSRSVDPSIIPEKWLSDVKFFDHIQGASGVCTWQCAVCFQRWDSNAKLPCPRCRPNWKDELAAINTKLPKGASERRIKRMAEVIVSSNLSTNERELVEYLTTNINPILAVRVPAAQGRETEQSVALKNAAIEIIDLADSIKFKTSHPPDVLASLIAKHLNGERCYLETTGGHPVIRSEHLFDNTDCCVYCGKFKSAGTQVVDRAAVLEEVAKYIANKAIEYRDQGERWGRKVTAGTSSEYTTRAGHQRS